jgi:hypothetical protein
MRDNLETKESFLIEELLQLTLNAGMSTRNNSFPIYDLENINLNEARRLRKEIKSFLLNYFEALKERCITETEHVNKILELSKLITTKYNAILFQKKFRIGISQKLINLFLKYLWCLDFIDKPCHCPFDNIIKLKIRSKFKEARLIDWTEMNKIKDYLFYVEKARIISSNEGLSISEWELINWKRR